MTLEQQLLRMRMAELSNILYNASQANSITKDDILDTVKRILENHNSNYNRDKNMQVSIMDFRKYT